MPIPTMTSDALSTAAACALAAALTACGAPREAMADPAPARVIVKLVRNSDNAAAIAADASRVAGVPVTYAAAASPAWHALALHCTDQVGCDAAIARLRAAATIYETVEVDSRKTRSAS